MKIPVLPKGLYNSHNTGPEARPKCRSVPGKWPALYRRQRLINSLQIHTTFGFLGYSIYPPSPTARNRALPCFYIHGR